VKNAAGAVGRLAGKIEMAFEILVEGHAVAKQILDATPRLTREQQGDVLIDDAGAGANGIGGVASGLSPSESAAAMPACAQTLDPPWPKGVTETTVTGSGASLSAVNRPARPAPTITTPPLCDRCWTLSKADLSFVAMARVTRHSGQ
jgi:hypothetical protein